MNDRGPTGGPILDDDAPKQVMRRGDDPLLDGALDALRKAGGSDPFYRNVQGQLKEPTYDGEKPPDSAAVYVEPQPLPADTNVDTEPQQKVLVDPNLLIDRRKLPTRKINRAEVNAAVLKAQAAQASANVQ